MNVTSSRRHTLERLLAATLGYGTWVASAVVTWGLMRAYAGGPSHIDGALDMRVVSFGIALFIVLPMLRVLLMALVFAWQREYAFAGIATLVLVIIGLGLALGMRSATPTPTPAPTSKETRQDFRAQGEALGRTIGTTAQPARR